MLINQRRGCSTISDTKEDGKFQKHTWQGFAIEQESHICAVIFQRSRSEAVRGEVLSAPPCWNTFKLGNKKGTFQRKKKKKEAGPRLVLSRRKRLLPSNARSHSPRRHAAALPSQATCLSGLKVLGKLQTIFQPYVCLILEGTVRKKKNEIKAMF